MLANKSNLCFSYENLERATDYFSDKNKQDESQVEEEAYEEA
jgi:hypothetical protein